MISELEEFLFSSKIIVAIGLLYYSLVIIRFDVFVFKFSFWNMFVFIYVVSIVPLNF